jgi:hypothetical protein
MKFVRRHLGKLIAAALLGGVACAHFAVNARARISPPPIAEPRGDANRPSPTLRRFGDSYALSRGKLLEVGLRGSPQQIGFQHARLLYPEMVANEGILLGRFQEQVPSRIARRLQAGVDIAGAGEPQPVAVDRVDVRLEEVECPHLDVVEGGEVRREQRADRSAADDADSHDAGSPSGI